MALLEVAGMKDDYLAPKKIQLCGNFTALQNDPSMPCDLPRSDDALFGAPFVSPSTYNVSELMLKEKTQNSYFTEVVAVQPDGERWRTR